jgi:hypothetical protein
MPGDFHRNLDARVTLHDEVAELTLLPVWVFAVRHSEEEPPVQILINGQTGVVGGDVPRSVGRIILAVLLGIALVIAVVLLIIGVFA